MKKLKMAQLLFLLFPFLCFGSLDFLHIPKTGGTTLHSLLQRSYGEVEALEKAKRANQIYKEKFLLEDQLLQLGKFHDRLSKKTKYFAWAW
jgi:hypothetical protein